MANSSEDVQTGRISIPTAPRPTIVKATKRICAIRHSLPFFVASISACILRAVSAVSNLAQTCSRRPVTIKGARTKELHMLGTILIVILVLALFGALPRWSHSKDWGYFPTGGVGLVLLVVVILLVL